MSGNSVCNPDTPMPEANFGAGTRVYTAEVVVWLAMQNSVARSGMMSVDFEMKPNYHGY